MEHAKPFVTTNASRNMGNATLLTINMHARNVVIKGKYFLDDMTFKEYIDLYTW